MLIPYDQLEADTLTRLIEDVVSRDGTDNGDDTPQETRTLRVRQALGKGQAVIFLILKVSNVYCCPSMQCPKSTLINACPKG